MSGTGHDFKRFGQKRMVRIRECRLGDAPGMLPAYAVDIDQEPHQLGHRDGGVRVVELNGHMVCELRDVAMLLQVTVNEVLKRCRGEEVLLAQAKFLAGGRRIAGVKHLRDRFRPNLLGLGRDIIARVEDIEAQGIGRARTP